MLPNTPDCRSAAGPLYDATQCQRIHKRGLICRKNMALIALGMPSARVFIDAGKMGHVQDEVAPQTKRGVFTRCYESAVNANYMGTHLFSGRVGHDYRPFLAEPRYVCAQHAQPA